VIENSKSAKGYLDNLTSFLDFTAEISVFQTTSVYVFDLYVRGEI